MLRGFACFAVASGASISAHMEDESLPIFDAQHVVAGSVSKTGLFASLEFGRDNTQLLVTLPVSALQPLAQLCRELEAMAVDAKNGVAGRWHLRGLAELHDA
jgi:hypothetical protein